MILVPILYKCSFFLSHLLYIPPPDNAKKEITFLLNSCKFLVSIDPCNKRQINKRKTSKFINIGSVHHSGETSVKGNSKQ